MHLPSASPARVASRLYLEQLEPAFNRLTGLKSVSLELVAEKEKSLAETVGSVLRQSGPTVATVAETARRRYCSGSAPHLAGR